ncbi:hypothetical protein MCOR27_000900 [Pyricularia oryzae]|uniref:Uncharacterized protein n=1 Tax=Pyricularia grisea TaxID=148305 RepID=A0ABQ8NU53_PYRGI|nr:hypothetical protein MCOR01_008074 [Pyricularia oryzae]KAI6302169.1 hypothetical protein MCOR33_002485 [Pyricularia grisea]KAI6261510.1 hypothetical protein MCOR19_002206 [Pyricularia oryzae]KAI6283995.1 hypothetical protein MCOR26_002122 [Pyricularia oryzae]KAI6288581.1 hypothetical protein MCOR27_000900 [Pyricularia oryzae]
MPIAHPVYVLANYNLSGEHGAHTESLSANASRILQPDRFTFQTANANPTSNQQNVALAIICIFPIMAFFMVSLRIYSRTRARQIWIDDILMGLAMLLMIPMTVGSYMCKPPLRRQLQYTTQNNIPTNTTSQSPKPASWGSTSATCP